MAEYQRYDLMGMVSVHAEAADVAEVQQEIEAEGELRLGAVSNSRMPEGKVRMTFLPASAFKEPDPDFKPTATVSARGQETMRYTCVNGHDLCSTSYPGPECPYCEKRPLRPGEDII